MKTIHIQALYRTRESLPSGCILHAELYNASLADAPGEVAVVARLVQSADQSLAFSLSYDPASIDTRCEYAVGVTIRLAGRIIKHTDTVQRVSLDSDEVQSIRLV